MTIQFITSDIHFNHLNILKYNAETRGHFKDVTEMNEGIIQRWNSVVAPEDHTFILGDVAMGDVSKAPALIERLNGTKTLVLGNHDRKLVKITDIERLFSGGIHNYLVHSVDKHTHLVMFHFPIHSWDNRGIGAIHTHGHTHGAPTGIQGRIIDVGMDCNNLYPFKLSDVVSKMNAIPRPTHDHHRKEI